MKPRKPIARASAKRLERHPELLRAGRTVLASSSPKRSVSKKGRGEFADDAKQVGMIELKRRLAAQGRRKSIAKSTKRIRVKPRTKAERERIYGTEDKQAWMHSLPCHFCGVVGYTQICHAKTGGTGRKDDAERTFPACGPHYQTNDQGQGRSVEGCHAKQPPKAERLAIAAIYTAQWSARMDEQGVGGGEC